MRWVNVRPSHRGGLLLGALPLLAVLVAYLFAATARHAANPSDKILPIPSAMIAEIFHALHQRGPSTLTLYWALSWPRGQPAPA